MTHTPGPWAFQYDVIYSPSTGRNIGEIYPHEGENLEYLDKQDVADRALIVAAPDMLAALKAAREAISTLDVDALGVATCDYHGAPYQYPIRDELLDNLNKVIAKAEAQP